jgi:predicted Zn-dependent protease with MMP-like domain
MQMAKEKFIRLVEEAMASLPERFAGRINNVALFVEDFPAKEQLRKLGMRKDQTLFGLFEGFAQGRRINLGPVLPDRITIFRKPIIERYDTEAEVRRQVLSTVKHEIAHHFGLDESGASRAGIVK